MLSPGSTIPQVTIPPTPGLCNEPTQLRDLAAQGPIVIYSYPADNTPMCTRQACMVRDTVAEHAEELKAAGLRVVGVSPQGARSHERFSSRHNLAFPIIADEDKAILRALEALGPLGIPRRVTYLLRSDGTIGDAITADLRLSRHTKFIRQALETVGA
ncbi:MAG: peroxiredoxin [Phycisphaerales bacterium]